MFRDTAGFLKGGWRNQRVVCLPGYKAQANQRPGLVHIAALLLVACGDTGADSSAKFAVTDPAYRQIVRCHVMAGHYQRHPPTIMQNYDLAAIEDESAKAGAALLRQQQPATSFAGDVAANSAAIISDLPGPDDIDLTLENFEAACKRFL